MDGAHYSEFTNCSNQPSIEKVMLFARSMGVILHHNGVNFSLTESSKSQRLFLCVLADRRYGKTPLDAALTFSSCRSAMAALKSLERNQMENGRDIKYEFGHCGVTKNRDSTST